MLSDSPSTGEEFKAMILTAMHIAILLFAASITVAPALIWFTSTYKIKIRKRKKKERKNDFQWPPVR